MTPVRLPAAIPVWLDFASDAELEALLRLVVEAVERRGFRSTVTYLKPAA